LTWKIFRQKFILNPGKYTREKNEKKKKETQLLATPFLFSFLNTVAQEL